MTTYQKINALGYILHIVITILPGECVHLHYCSFFNIHLLSALNSASLCYCWAFTLVHGDYFLRKIAISSNFLLQKFYLLKNKNYWPNDLVAKWHFHSLQECGGGWVHQLKSCGVWKSLINQKVQTSICFFFEIFIWSSTMKLFLVRWFMLCHDLMFTYSASF